MKNFRRKIASVLILSLMLNNGFSLYENEISDVIDSQVENLRSGTLSNYKTNDELNNEEATLTNQVYDFIEEDENSFDVENNTNDSSNNIDNDNNYENEEKIIANENDTEEEIEENDNSETEYEEEPEEENINQNENEDDGEIQNKNINDENETILNEEDDDDNEDNKNVNEEEQEENENSLDDINEEEQEEDITSLDDEIDEGITLFDDNNESEREEENILLDDENEEITENSEELEEDLTSLDDINENENITSLDDNEEIKDISSKDFDDTEIIENINEQETNEESIEKIIDNEDIQNDDSNEKIIESETSVQEETIESEMVNEENVEETTTTDIISLDDEIEECETIETTEVNNDNNETANEDITSLDDISTPSEIDEEIIEEEIANSLDENEEDIATNSEIDEEISSSENNIDTISTSSEVDDIENIEDENNVCDNNISTPSNTNEINVDDIYDISTPSNIIGLDDNISTPSDIENVSTPSEINGENLIATRSEIDLINVATLSEIDLLNLATQSEIVNIATISYMEDPTLLGETVGVDYGYWYVTDESGNPGVAFIDTYNVLHLTTDDSRGIVTNQSGKFTFGSAPNVNFGKDVSRNIKKVVFESDFAPTTLNSLFGGYYEVWEFCFENLKKIEGMKEHLNTANVTDMSYMFYCCRSLASIDTTGFNTENVTNMKLMFYGTYALTTLDISSFKTGVGKTINVYSMFRDCINIHTIYAIDEFNNLSSSDEDSPLTFDGCKKLVGGNGTIYSYSSRGYTHAKVDKDGQPGYFTDKTINAHYLNKVVSYEAYNHIEIRKVNSVTEPTIVRANDGDDLYIRVLPKSGYTIRDVRIVAKESGINVSLSPISSNTYYYKMPSGANALNQNEVITIIAKISGEDSGYWYVTDESGNPGGASLGRYNVLHLTTDDSRDLIDEKSGMFYFGNQPYNNFPGMNGLIKRIVFDSDFEPSSTMNNLFGSTYYRFYCLTQIDGMKEHLNTENVTNMAEMFEGCAVLTSIDLSGFKNGTSGNIYIYDMFESCKNLETIYATDDFNNLYAGSSSDSWVFRFCENLVGGNGTTYSSSHINSDYARVDKPGQPGYFTNKSVSTHYINKEINTGQGSIIVRNSDSTSGAEIRRAYEGDDLYIFVSQSSGIINDIKVKGKNSGINLPVSEYSNNVYYCKVLDGAGALAENENIIVQLEIDPVNVRYWYVTDESGNLGEASLDTFNVLHLTADNSHGTVTNQSGTFTFGSNPNQNFPSVYNKIKKVVFHTDFTPTTTKYLFGSSSSYCFSKLEKIEGLNEHLKFNNIKDMSYMFYYCQALTTLDLSGFKNEISGSINIAYMFSNCTNLETIYAIDDFNNLTGNDVFSSCDKLAGGNGTAWNSSNTDYNYAKIDKDGQVGYFTDKTIIVLLHYLNKVYDSTLGSVAIRKTNSTTDVEIGRAKDGDDLYIFVSPDSGNSVGEVRVTAEESGIDIILSEISSNIYYYKIPSGTSALNVNEKINIKIKFTNPDVGYWYVTDESGNIGVAELDTYNVLHLTTEYNYGTVSGQSGKFTFGKRPNQNFRNAYNKVIKVVFDTDFAPTTTTYLFGYSSSGSVVANLVQIEGMSEHLHTENVTTMNYMFAYCTELTSVDLSGFKNGISGNITANYMFRNCTNLETIYATDEFNNLTGSSVFASCNNLIGGNGTKFSNTGYTYAKVDNTINVGYFTDKNLSHKINKKTKFGEVEDDSKGSFEIKRGGVNPTSYEVTKGVVGEEEKISVTVNEYYAVDTIKLLATKNDGTNIEIIPTLINQTTTVPIVYDYTCTIPTDLMVGSDIDAEVKIKATEYSIIKNISEKGTFIVQDTATYSEVVHITNIQPSLGFESPQITVTKESGGTVSLNTISDTEKTFIMPDENVTISINCDYIIYTITNLTLPTKGSSDPLPTIATVNQIIHITNIQKVDPLDSLVAIKIEKEDNPNIKVTAVKVDNTHYYFVMPAYNINVTLYFAREYLVNIIPVANGTATSNVNVAEEGAPVTITVSTNGKFVADGINVKTATTSQVITFNKVGNNKYTFTMPAENVNVTAIIKGKQHSSGGSGGGGTPHAGKNGILGQDLNPRIFAGKRRIQVLESDCQWEKDIDDDWILTYTGDGLTKEMYKDIFVDILSIVEGKKEGQSEIIIRRTYLFDEKGKMFRGWFEAPDNRWLFFDCGPTETYGMMVENQWSLINGQWYRFYEDGYLCQGKLTPDFYFVDKDGVWIEIIPQQTIIEMLWKKEKPSVSISNKR